MTDFKIGDRVFINDELNPWEFSDKFLKWAKEHYPVAGHITGKDRIDGYWIVMFEDHYPLNDENAGAFLTRELIIDKEVTLEEVVSETDALLVDGAIASNTLYSQEPITLPKNLEDVEAITAQELNGTHIGQVIALDTSDEPDAEVYTSLIIGTLECVHHLKLNDGTSYVSITVQGKLGDSYWEIQMNIDANQEVWV